MVLVLPAMRQANARTEVSVDFFYDNLGSDGSWVEVADYGYCWQPTVAVSNSGWRPYADGYWAYTDVGWTWVSYEDFGWATYHYGRWVRLHDHGWFWVPGREWGPAWVSWRTGGDYVGWAPLPPHRHGEVAYENRPIGVQVDVEFDIGPAYYNFVDVRYIGEPVLRERIFAPSLNVTYVTQTVNVTNITYTNSTVYNYGPDYARLNRYSTRPIRRMTLEHDTNADLSVAIKSKEFTRVQGDKLVIAAPLTIQKPSESIAPKAVKEKIVKPKFEHGWSDVSDPKAEAELKQKMKGEDSKNVPPPTVKPRENAEAVQSPASVSPVNGTTPASEASPAQPPDKGKDKHGEHASPMPNSAPSIDPALSPATTPPGKHQKERGEKPAPDNRQQDSPSSLATSPDGTPFREPSPRDKGLKRDKHTEKAPNIMPPTRQPSDVLTEKAPRKSKDEPTPAPPNREEQLDVPHKRPLPPERVAPPKREVPPDVPHKQLPPERIAPPPRPMPPEVQHKQPPPERIAPPPRPMPPEVPRKQPPVDRIAPPPHPEANGPVKGDAPQKKRGPGKDKDEPAAPDS